MAAYPKTVIPLDWQVLKDILRDEVVWGLRGEANEEGSKTYKAIFDTRGDAEKFRRIVLRAGYKADPIREDDVTEYEGMDYIVEVTERK
jgi:hypothetical protein